jgi:hypothetical protein
VVSIVATVSPTVAIMSPALTAVEEVEERTGEEQQVREDA